MRIAIFTDGFPPYISGVATAVVNQIEQLAQLGHQIIVISPFPTVYSGSAGKLECVRIYRLGLSLRWPFLPQLWLGVPTCIKSLFLLKKFQPDVIHVHTEGAAGLEGLISAYLLKLPVIGNFNTLYADRNYLYSYLFLSGVWIQRLVWLYQKLFFNNCNVVIAPTQTIRDLLLKQGFTREIEILSYGIESISKEYRYSTEDIRAKYDCKNSFNILYIGRISFEKNIEILVSAFEKLCQYHSHLKFIIIGEGNWMSLLRQKIKLSPNCDKYIFLGGVPHERLIKLGLYRLGDIYLSASKTETEGIAMREAMVYGLPVLAVKANASSEIVIHEYNGFLLDPDSIDEFTSSIEQLSKDSVLLKKMGKQAIQSVDAYTIKKVVERLVEIYSSTIIPL
jgi:1,2-diacylglycerol 3-alpha-glucosyltransferase